MGCTAVCWTRVECPTCGRLLVPRGRDGGFMTYEAPCCEAVVWDSDVNTAHLWSEHDSTRWYTDREGWDEHEKNCPKCNGDEDRLT